jgi:hypothetical protein
VRSLVDGRRSRAGRRRLLRDIATIEEHLRFRTDDPDDERLLQRRRALRGELASLSEADTHTLVGRVFEPIDREKLAADFQTLHRATRAELLRIMLGRLEHVAAETLHSALTNPQQEPRLRTRLAELVPDPKTRREMLTILSGRFAHRHAAVMGQKLWVHLDAAGFKNTGTSSAGNRCPECPVLLGSKRPDGKNGMELRGDIAGNGHGVVFDFKRTIERATWKLVEGSWIPLSHRPAGENDDGYETDEDHTGDDGHIYAIDTPGPTIQSPPSLDPFWPGDPNATGLFYVASFLEWVEVDVGGTPTRVSDVFAWHSASTLEKVNGQWRRNESATNEILPGPIPVLSPDGDAPPPKRQGE